MMDIKATPNEEGGLVRLHASGVVEVSNWTFDANGGPVSPRGLIEAALAAIKVASDEEEDARKDGLFVINGHVDYTTDGGWKERT